MKLFKLCSECTYEFEIASDKPERCPVCGNTQLTDIWPMPVETDNEWPMEEGLDYSSME
jgi:RNA polymerase subunit RPABC4/transcription elongation factor Spt4